MSNEKAARLKAGEERESDSLNPMDLLSTPEMRERFEQTSAALEAADLIRGMRQQALSTTGVRGISQEELAQRTGLSQPRISQIEKGAGRDGVTYAVLRKIAYACGIDWGAQLRAVIAGLQQSQQPQAKVGVKVATLPTKVAAAERSVEAESHGPYNWVQFPDELLSNWQPSIMNWESVSFDLEKLEIAAVDINRANPYGLVLDWVMQSGGTLEYELKDLSETIVSETGKITR